MKRLIKNTIIAALAAVTLAACSDSEDDSLSLDGDCNVEAVKLDDFIGNCDPKTATSSSVCPKFTKHRQ